MLFPYADSSVIQKRRAEQSFVVLTVKSGWHDRFLIN